MPKPGNDSSTASTMKALVFHGPHSLALEDRPKPTILQPTDAIVRLRMVQTGRLDAKRLVSQRLLADILKAYGTFADAAKECALKVVIKNASPHAAGVQVNH